MLVVMIGVVVWVGRQNRELHREVATLQRAARPVPGGVYSAALVSSSVRGESARRTVALPADAHMLRLDLELGGMAVAPRGVDLRAHIARLIAERSGGAA